MALENTDKQVQAVKATLLNNVATWNPATVAVDIISYVLENMPDDMVLELDLNITYCQTCKVAAVEHKNPGAHVVYEFNYRNDNVTLVVFADEVLQGEAFIAATRRYLITCENNIWFSLHQHIMFMFLSNLHYAYEPLLKASGLEASGVNERAWAMLVETMYAHGLQQSDVVRIECVNSEALRLNLKNTNITIGIEFEGNTEMVYVDYDQSGIFGKGIYTYDHYLGDKIHEEFIEIARRLSYTPRAIPLELFRIALNEHKVDEVQEDWAVADRLIYNFKLPKPTYCTKRYASTSVDRESEGYLVLHYGHLCDSNCARITVSSKEQDVCVGYVRQSERDLIEYRGSIASNRTTDFFNALSVMLHEDFSNA